MSKSTATVVAAKISDPALPSLTLIDPVLGCPAVKLPLWTKNRATKSPTNKQKSPKLGEDIKHLSSLFEPQLTESTLIIYKIQSSCSIYIKKSWESSRVSPAQMTSTTLTNTIMMSKTTKGKTKCKPFLHYSLRIKYLLAYLEAIRNHGRVADICA